MKKMLATLMALGLALSLAACSTSSGSSAAANSNNSSATSDTASGSDKVWLVATDTVFVPFEYTDEQGNFVGIDVDILAAIAKDQGFQYEMNSIGWDGAVAAVRARSGGRHHGRRFHQAGAH